MEVILQNLREELVNKIGQRIEKEFEKKEVYRVYEILVLSYTILQKARKERELIAIYDMLAGRLKEITYSYKSRFRLGYVLYRLAEIIHESIAEYLPHRIRETYLVKILWPYNCHNIDQMKIVLHKYVMYNTALLGSNDRLAADLLSPYIEQIENAVDLRQLRYIYEDAEIYLRVLEDEAYEKNEYKEAWEVGVIASAISYMFYDFYNCFYP